MGLIDEFLSQTLASRNTGTDASHAGIGGVLTQLLGGQGATQPGGQQAAIGGLLDRFKAAGLGHLAESWVGNGSNLPVEPGQLRQVLGGEQTQQMAAQSGVSSETLLSQLAQHLPGLVDRMTPNGTMPAGEGLAGEDGEARTVDT